MRIRHFIHGLALLLFAIHAAPSGAAEPANSPSTFVTKLAQKALSSVNSGTLSSAERQRQLEGLVNADFDLSRISNFLLSPDWRMASETERHHFTAVLRAFIVRIYRQRFSAYGSGSLRAGGQRSDAANGTVVHPEITDPVSGQTIRGSVARHSGRRLQVVDVSVAGISMTRAKRDEFASYLRGNGGDLVDLTLRLQAVLTAQAQQSR